MGWRPRIWNLIQSLITEDNKVKVDATITPADNQKVNIDQTTDGVTNKVQARNATHDDFNTNANVQVGNADVGNANPVPVDVRTIQAGANIVGQVGIDQTTDGTTNKVQARNAAHDNFNSNANMQVGNADVGSANPVPTENENKVLPITFHDAAVAAEAGLEFEVGEYRNLRIAISGTATSFTLLFKGQSGVVIEDLLGIESVSLALVTSATLKDKIYEFDISEYDKVWFGLSAVAGGNITVTGKAGN